MSKFSVPLVMESQRFDRFGDSLCIREVMFIGCIKKIGSGSAKPRAWRMQLESRFKRSDHYPSPPILWFIPFVVGIKDGFLNVVAKVAEVMTEAPARQRSRKSGDIFKEAGQR